MKKVQLFFLMLSFGIIIICTSLYLTNLKPHHSFMKIYKFLPLKSEGTRNKVDIVKFCKNYRQRERANPNYLYMYKSNSSKTSLLWCKVPKAASTTLTKFYLKLRGFYNKTFENESSNEDSKGRKNITKVHKMLRDFYPKLSMKEIANLTESKKVIKFIVVRDPFERILSAYRDKLENYERDLKYRNGYYYENYGKFMIDQSKNTTGVKIIVPTWPQFVSYLLKTSISRFDEHWMPISRLCSPCAIQYDYMIKLEHFDSQIKFPLKRVFGTGETQEINLGWSHRTGSRKLIKKYFNNLTLIDLKKLYGKYRRDFQLFGYKPHKYFKLVS